MGQMIRKNGPYVESDARALFAQIVAAIEYLHGMDVAHRDLKPENVLLNHQNQVKVADFGLANFCRDTLNNSRVLLYTRCGTRMYMPPEVLNTEDGYNAMFFDVWSMGEFSRKLSSRVTYARASNTSKSAVYEHPEIT